MSKIARQFRTDLDAGVFAIGRDPVTFPGMGWPRRRVRKTRAIMKRLGRRQERYSARAQTGEP